MEKRHMFKSTQVAVGTLAGLVFASASASAAVTPVTLEFSEVALANGTPLAGSEAFAAYGVHFVGTTKFAIDPIFVGAGSDNSGITTGLNPSLMGVSFDQGATSVSFSGVSLNTVFIADAFDMNGVLLASYTPTFLPAVQYYSHTFSGIGVIGRVEFHDNANFIGVGRLEFEPVPEPATAGLGLLAAVQCLASRVRRR